MKIENIVELVADNVDGICYVSDIETYDLLFLNKNGRDLIGVIDDSYIGQKCYKILQGKSEVCEFCTNDKILKDKFFVWDYFNEIIQRHYELKDILLEVDGRKLRLEFAVDITGKKLELDNMKIKLSREETLMRCVKTLSIDIDFQVAINCLLNIVGDYYNSDRSYIFEIDKDNQMLSNTYEWCKDGVIPEIANLQGLPLSAITRWRKKFDEIGEFSISSLGKELDNDSEEYEILSSQGIESLIAAPFKNGAQLLGFIGVDNPVDHIDDAFLLRSISLFVLDNFQKRRTLMVSEMVSYTDSLTRAYNRHKYNSIVEELDNKRDTTIGIIFADINGLKKVNDKYGHEIGDSLIVESVVFLTKHFPGDVFRVGGDEFVVLSVGITNKDFERQVLRLDNDLKNQIDVSLSIGSAWCNEGESLVELIARADELMYINKDNYYKNLQVFSKEHRIDEKLMNLINNNEFIVFLQPKVDLQNNNKIVSAEALIRRKNSEGGFIPPDNFLPAYEADGSIRHIDFFVLKTVCRTLRNWKDTGYKLLPIAVNFSRNTIVEHDIAKKLKRTCTIFGIESRFIVIEITEHITSIKMDSLLRIIDSIKKEGFIVSLDDFGAEYANLAILTAMSFNEIKLDKSIVDHVSNSESQRMVIEYIIKMCHVVDSTITVAEGIETVEQMELLRDADCNYGQGYFFYRPIPISDFEKNFLEWDKITLT